MNWGKVLGYGLLVIGGLIAVRLAIGAVLGFLSLLWTLITTGVALAVIAGLLYGGYRLLSWARDDESSTESNTVDTTRSGPEDGVETLKQKYASGKLSEEEFERRLEQELGGPSIDSLDRELTRERE
jgi:uncharacterized membrane protein